MHIRSERARRPVRRAATAVAITALLGTTGCRVTDRATAEPLREVDPGLYELEITSCEIESEQDTIDALGEPLIGEGRRPTLAVGYTVANLDNERRRFQLRVTSTDSAGQSLRLIAHDTDRRDPQDSTDGVIRQPVAETEEPPFTCTVEVWDSPLDQAFPDD